MSKPAGVSAALIGGVADSLTLRTATSRSFYEAPHCRPAFKQILNLSALRK
jgi:hypothetical protein